MFKIGDRVKFKKSSIDSGMIDATEDDVFNISHVVPSSKDVWIEGHLGWWSTEHIEHVKEGAMTNTDDAMNNTEEQEIKWEVGQEVFCLLRGKGVVTRVGAEGNPYPVEVDFEETFDRYTLDGKIFDEYGGRVLFFSQPVVTAELFPPKKPFEPILLEGDTVVVKRKTLTETSALTVVYEEEDAVWFLEDPDGYLKTAWDFYKLGEEIKFS